LPSVFGDNGDRLVAQEQNYGRVAWTVQFSVVSGKLQRRVLAKES